MKVYLCLYIALFSVVCSVADAGILFASTRQKNTDAENYYAALSSSDTVKINKVLQQLEPLNSLANKAYAGTLLMKKSNFVKPPKNKLELFKKGKLLLEEAIAKDNTNAGYRFLRLVIQENCPAILNYHENIKEDTDTVKKYYKQFPPEAQEAVIDYAKTSVALKSIEAN